MKVKYTKYLFLGALAGALIWFVILEIAISIVHSTLSFFPGLIAVVLGTYIGLWSIGKMRNPLFAYGILVGVASFLLYLPLLVLSMSMHPSVYEELRILYWNVLPGTALWHSVFSLIVSLVAGILGITIVRRVSPSFCPNCGNKLSPGEDICSKCGTKL